MILTLLSVQDYYMHTDTVKDPFSTVFGLFQPSIPYFKHVAPTIRVEETLPDSTGTVEDSSSQFQKAMAMSLLHAAKAAGT